MLMKESNSAEELSKKLGFSETWFLEREFVLVEGMNKKEIVKKIEEGKKKGLKAVVRAASEEILRWVLEKTAADMVYGAELINKKDSVHFCRGGLDQVLCKIAAARGKIIGFSLQGLFDDASGKILGRMIFNMRLCEKYNVQTFIGNFSTEKREMRAAKELEAWEKVLKTRKKKIGLN